MKNKKSKFRIRLFTPFEDGLTDTELIIVRSKNGLYNISVSFYYSEDDVDPGRSCNYYQNNIAPNEMDHFIASIAYTLVHEHLPSQSDITSILIKFDKAFNKSNSVEELINNLKSDGYQSDSVYFVTKETDEKGDTWIVNNEIKESKLYEGNNPIVKRIMDDIYAEIDLESKIKKVSPTEEEKEYIIKYVGGENETN